MDWVSLLVGVVAGAVVAGVLALGRSRAGVSRLKAEAQRLQRELDLSVKQGQERVAQIQAKHGDCGRGIAAQRQKVQALEKAVSQQGEELDRMRQSIVSSERSRDQALEQASAHQSSRVQAEGKLKQAERLAAESVDRLAALERQVAQLGQDRETIKVAADKRADEVRRLRAELNSALESAGGQAQQSAVGMFADVDGSLQKILDTLLEHEGLQAAVLADTNGIVIAWAGDPALRDGVAATAQLFAALASQFEGMVPFSVVRSFSVRDTEAVAIAGRTFSAAGETVSLATYGSRTPNDRVLDGATASLDAALA